MTASTNPFPSTQLEWSFVDEMRTEGDAHGYVTPATKQLGFTLIHDRMVSETFFQRALADIGESVFDYGPVLSATDIFSAHFLESLDTTEKEILMPVVLQLVSRGDFPLHIWNIVGDDQVATRVA